MSTPEHPEEKSVAPATPRVGQILIRQGHLTEEQLSKALSVQEELSGRGVRRTLGEICVEQGWCEMRHIAEAMRIQQEHIFNATALGQVLIDIGALTLEQLEEALEKHESASTPLADFLVRRAYCTKQQLHTALEIQQVRRTISARQQTVSLYDPFNVMELLVNELLDGVIAEHQGCTCELCRANVFALALNSLPPRYISDHARLLIVAQSTRDEYAGLIRRKIAQAVEQVRKNPRPLCRRQARPAK
jgi:competence protein ComFB